MKKLRWEAYVLLPLLIAPLPSWGYFRFIHYPIELGRHSHVPFELVVFEEPSSFTGNLSQFIMELPLVFGSPIDNAQVRVELRRNGSLIDSKVIATSQEASSDHIPLMPTWSSHEVLIEDQESNRVEFHLPGAK